MKIANPMVVLAELHDLSFTALEGPIGVEQSLLDEERFVARPPLRDERISFLDRRERVEGLDAASVVLSHRDALCDLVEDNVGHGADSLTVEIRWRRTLEVALGERAAGTGLEVALEAQRLLLGRELNDDEQRPRTMLRHLARRPVIVPFDSVVDVAGHSGVMTFRIRVALQDVDETLAGPDHADASGTFGTIKAERNFLN